MTFELLLHAAFVADEIWGSMLEPTRGVLLDADLVRGERKAPEINAIKSV